MNKIIIEVDTFKEMYYYHFVPTVNNNKVFFYRRPNYSLLFSGNYRNLEWS